MDAQDVASTQDVVLSVRDLCVTYDTAAGAVRAVDKVSFDVHRGEAFALVGESGCGKSTTASAVMRLIGKPGRISGGEVVSHGQNLLALSEDEMADVRGSRIGMIFQNPLDSLNPVYSLGSQIAESLMVDRMEKTEAYKLAEETLRSVRIPDSAQRMGQYPHEISGGMRQRVMIGMMLCRKPEVLIADEPTTALDVTTQAGIIDLMNDLRREQGTAVLLITHDFGIVADVADRVAVMYAGQIVEMGSVWQIFDEARHPYTRLLMRALPTITKAEGRLETIKGTVPNLAKLPQGCLFRERCPHATAACSSFAHELVEVDPGHFVACAREVEAHG